MWRMINGELPTQHSPKVIVLHIGTNDLAGVSRSSTVHSPEGLTLYDTLFGSQSLDTLLWILATHVPLLMACFIATDALLPWKLSVSLPPSFPLSISLWPLSSASCLFSHALPFKLHLPQASLSAPLQQAPVWPHAPPSCNIPAHCINEAEPGAPTRPQALTQGPQSSHAQGLH